jgi:uncharacterized membrane protein HdeD (DUF308 family)
MLVRWSKAIMTFGAFLLLAGVLSSYLKLKTQLKFVDWTSGNPNWREPVATSFEEFMLRFPAGIVLLAGVILLMAGYLAHRRKSSANSK